MRNAQSVTVFQLKIILTVFKILGCEFDHDASVDTCALEFGNEFLLGLQVGLLQIHALCVQGTG